MKLTAELVISKHPCSNWPLERLQKFYGDGKTLIEVLKSENVSISDRIWTATRFLSDKQNRTFAIWCARQCKVTVKEIIEYINVIERFYNGEATEEELKVADRVAYRAADRAADWAADMAAYMAAYIDADWAAYRAAYWAAYWAADRAVKEQQIQYLINLCEQEEI